MTAQSEQFWTAETETETTLRTLRRRVSVAAVVVVVFVCSSWGIFLVKQDGKYSAIERTVKAIRSTQVDNTKTNDAIGRCDVTTGDDFIFDIVRLAQREPPTTGYRIPAPCKALAPTRTRK